MKYWDLLIRVEGRVGPALGFFVSETSKETQKMKLNREGLERIIEQVIRQESNKHHSKSGKFSSKKDSTCDSEWFSGGDRDRKGGGLTDKKDTGRGKKKKKGQGKFRCYDDSPKWESLIREVAFEEGLDEVDLKRRCESIGLLNFQDFLKLLDKVERAEKGTLMKGKGES